MRVLYFASVRESLGKEQETISLPDTVSTVADLIVYLVARHGETYQQVLENEKVLVAVDQVMASKNSKVAGAQEVAFFPPVTGG